MTTLEDIEVTDLLTRETEVPTTKAVKVRVGELRDAFRQVKHAVSKEPVRPILTAVLLEADGDRLRLVAADNYRIATTVIDAEGDLSALTPALVFASDLASLLPFLASKSDFDPCLLTRTGQSLSFQVYSEAVSYRLLDGTYPEWRAVVPASVGRVTAVNVKYLADLKAVKPVTGNLHMVVREWNEAIEFYSDANEPFREYIMPVRTSDTHPEPKP